MAKRQRISDAEFLKRLSEGRDASGDESEGNDYNYSEVTADRLPLVTSSDSSDEEISDEGPREEVSFRSGDRLIARDGTEWTVMDFAGKHVEGLAATSVFKAEWGPTAHSRNHVKKGMFSSPFDLLVTPEMLHHIQMCTEAEANRVLGKNSHWTMSIFELRAFIGLLYVRGVMGYRNLPLDILWSENFGLPVFGDTMSKQRFKEILRYLRFDLRETRSERLKTDKFALISEIWTSFIENCQKCYNPSCSLTADEQIIPSKAHCGYTKGNDPIKFNIKLWLLAEVESKYFFNGVPHVGDAEDDELEEKLPENVMMQLVSPLSGKGYNVTCGNFFTSGALASKLAREKTSLVGRLQPRRKEIPDVLKNTQFELHKSFIMKNQNGHTLTCYQHKKKKKMFVYSTLYSNCSVREAGKRKPETVLFYNGSKQAVKILDQMAKSLSFKSPSRRWPVQIFYNILDLAGINSWILYKKIYKGAVDRRKFLLSLSEELLQGFILEKRPVRANFWEQGLTVSAKRKQCQIGFCKNNKSNKTCFKCGKTACGKCGKSLVIINCKKCLPE